MLTTSAGRIRLEGRLEVLEAVTQQLLEATRQLEMPAPTGVAAALTQRLSDDTAQAEAAARLLLQECPELELSLRELAEAQRGLERALSARMKRLGFLMLHPLSAAQVAEREAILYSGRPLALRWYSPPTGLIAVAGLGVLKLVLVLVAVLAWLGLFLVSTVRNAEPITLTPGRLRVGAQTFDLCSMRSIEVRVDESKEWPVSLTIRSFVGAVTNLHLKVFPAALRRALVQRGVEVHDA